MSVLFQVNFYLTKKRWGRIRNEQWWILAYGRE